MTTLIVRLSWVGTRSTVLPDARCAVRSGTSDGPGPPGRVSAAGERGPGRYPRSVTERRNRPPSVHAEELGPVTSPAAPLQELPPDRATGTWCCEFELSGDAGVRSVTDPVG